LLKYYKDPFRGVDGIGYKKATFAKQMPIKTYYSEPGETG